MEAGWGGNALVPGAENSQREHNYSQEERNLEIQYLEAEGDARRRF